MVHNAVSLIFSSIRFQNCPLINCNFPIQPFDVKIFIEKSMQGLNQDLLIGGLNLQRGVQDL